MATGLRSVTKTSLCRQFIHYACMFNYLVHLQINHIRIYRNIMFVWPDRDRPIILQPQKYPVHLKLMIILMYPSHLSPMILRRMF